MTPEVVPDVVLDVVLAVVLDVVLDAVLDVVLEIADVAPAHVDVARDAVLVVFHAVAPGGRVTA